MSVLEFQCLKCGGCCRDLIWVKDGLKKGNTLTPKEAKLFPLEAISPHMAVGIEKPETVILYQLNVTDCPFIDQTNKCKIYSNRPLICQAFPIVENTYSTKCKVFSFSKYGMKIVIDWDMYQVEAGQKLDRYIINNFKKNFKKGISVWSFDLATNKWVLRNTYKEYTGTLKF